MDDLVMLSDYKSFLFDSLNQMNKILTTTLKLEFNNKTQIFPIKNGVDFLGFHFYLTETGKVIRKLRRSSKIRFKNRLKQLQYDYSNNKIKTEDINRSLASYKGHLQHGHTFKLRKHILSNLKFIKSFKN